MNLQGLDYQAATGLAEEVLNRIHKVRYLEEGAFQDLLALLKGYPLAIEVVLDNLRQQTPEEVLKGLKTGDGSLDSANKDLKTESMIRCIAYSVENLTQEEQQLLLCLAPFSSILLEPMLDKYIAYLKQQPAFVGVDFDGFKGVIRKITDWGLASPDEKMQGFLHLQPVLTYYLKNRLASQEEVKQAVEQAYVDFYTDAMCGSVYSLIHSKEAGEKRIGFFVANKEVENILNALRLALEQHESITNIFRVLNQHFESTRDFKTVLYIASNTINKLERYPKEFLESEKGAELAGMYHWIGSYHLRLGDYPAAKTAYQSALQYHLKLTMDKNVKRKSVATIYHQLGMVAQEQRQYEEAQGYYKKALEIFIEYNDRYEQAGTYHNLGIVAQNQRQYEEAQGYYKKALEIDIKYNNRYEQAKTYHQLGNVAYLQKEYEEAQDYYLKALEIDMEYNDLYDQAKTYYQLGIVAQEQRQYEEAKAYYLKAIEGYIEYSDHNKQAATYHQLGMIAQKQRKYKEAQGYYLKTLEVYSKYNALYEQAGTYHQLGMVAQKQRACEEAKSYYLKALEVYSEYNARYEQAKTYHQLGTLAEEQREYEEAKDYYLKALEIFKEYNAHYDQAGTYHQLGRVACFQREYEEAKDYYLTSWRIYYEFEDESLLPIVCRSLFRLYDAHPAEDLFHQMAQCINTSEEDIKKFYHAWKHGEGEEDQ